MTFLVDLIEKGLVTHPTGKRFFSWVYSSHNIYRMFLDTSFRQMSFLPCVSYRDVSECLFAHHILQAKGFSPVCIFTWHFKMSRHTSYTQIAFLPCVSSHDILKCLVTHLGDKWIFFCVYLLMTFQGVSRDILQAKSFSHVCLFSWYFRMSLGTSGRQMAFLLCVSSCDVSECLVTHPTGKGVFSFVYLLLMFQNVSSHIQQA